MSLDVAPAIRTALIAESPISGLMSEWEGQPAIFTKRPIPDDAMEPMIVINPDVSITDVDGLISRRPVVVRDIVVYGKQPDDYRLVETVAYLVRDLFHRQKFSINVAGYDVVQILASGPRPAPTDDESTIARVITLTITMRKSP